MPLAALSLRDWTWTQLRVDIVVKSDEQKHKISRFYSIQYNKITLGNPLDRFSCRRATSSQGLVRICNKNNVDSRFLHRKDNKIGEWTLFFCMEVFFSSDLIR